MLNALLKYGFKYSFSKFLFNTIFSIFFNEILSFIYFSIIRLAILPAHTDPYPAFSTNTEIAIVGFSFGAYAIKIE